MLKILKILLIVSVAAFGLIGALGNVLDWAGTYGAVEAATSMATWEGGGGDWRATTNPAVVFVGAAMIPLLKVVFSVLCLAGAARMFAARGRGGAEFDRAKELALAGCGLAILMLFAGWIVIAETWFELWRSEALRSAALESAFRYGGFIGLIALFVAMREQAAD